MDRSSGLEFIRKPPSDAPEEVKRRAEAIDWKKVGLKERVLAVMVCPPACAHTSHPTHTHTQEPIPYSSLPANMREDIDATLKEVLHKDEWLQLRPAAEGR